LADERQKRKHFLSAKRTFLTVDRLNLSFRIEGFQRVEGFPFLTTKKPKANPTPERVPTAQAKAADVGSIFKNTGTRRSATPTVCILQSKFRTCEISS
jgi:hypothetical protein